jgi:DNA-directed RNA polymerase subunit RPC12/RpoP
MPGEPKRFRRLQEDFRCFNCGTEVKGTGYTDHCPRCLWSLHVDDNPGDRSSPCRGKMEPVSVIYKNGEFIINYVCAKCDTKKKFGAAVNDDKELLASLVKMAM